MNKLHIKFILIKNFKKDVICICQSEEEAYLKENLPLLYFTVIARPLMGQKVQIMPFGFYIKIQTEHILLM